MATVKLLIVVGMIYVVGGALQQAWQDLQQRELSINYGLAILSGVVFLASQLPMAWYWRQILLALDQPAPFVPATIAFYVSQIGKYIPGKAAVVLIRTERMLRSGGSKRLIVSAVFLETLTIMAVGGVLAAVLIALLHEEADGESQQRVWLVGLSACLALGCLLPTVPPIARKILLKVAPQEQDAPLFTTNLNRWVMLQGWGAALITWSGYGVSVWLAAWSVGATGGMAEMPGSSQVLIWVLAAALPTVAGFLSLLPAGVVVRDGLMLVLLAPHIGEANALAATLATRLIWILSEVIGCGILVSLVDPLWKRVSRAS